MTTAGIDLSADPAKTGVAWVSRTDGGWRVEDVSVGKHDDGGLCEVVRAAEKSGIDCPLGWPSPFVDYVVAHRDGGAGLVVPDGRISLTHRSTDHYVTAVTGLRPLSVSADRIGSAAMRCAALMAALAVDGVNIDRTGRTGPVVEVYPAAALKIWGLPHRAYKGPEVVRRGARSTLLDRVTERLGLDLGLHADLALASDDALDAILCAVIAGLSLSGECVPVPDEALALAATEGWIALPRHGR